MGKSQMGQWSWVAVTKLGQLYIIIWAIVGCSCIKEADQLLLSAESEGCKKIDSKSKNTWPEKDAKQASFVR